MNCRDYQQMISKLVDLEVKAATSAGLFQHLGQCAQCREFLDTVMKLTAELDKIGVPLELSEATNNQRPYSPDARAVALAAKSISIGSSIRTLALAILIIVIGCVMFSTTISFGARGESAIQTTQENGIR